MIVRVWMLWYFCKIITHTQLFCGHVQNFTWTEEGSKDVYSAARQYCCSVRSNIWTWSLWYRDGICSSWTTWWVHSYPWCMIVSFWLLKMCTFITDYYFTADDYSADVFHEILQTKSEALEHWLAVGLVALWLRHQRIKQSWVQLLSGHCQVTTLSKLFTLLCLCHHVTVR